MKKSLIVSYFLFALTSSLSIELRADIGPGRAVSSGSWVTLSNSYNESINDFGMHCFFGNCSSADSFYITTGTDASPYILAHAHSIYEDFGRFAIYQPVQLEGFVMYNWKVVRIDGGASSEVVPVHISIHGHYSKSVSTSITDVDRELFLEEGRPLVHAPDSRVNGSIYVQLIGAGYNECYGAGDVGSSCINGDNSYQLMSNDGGDGTIDTRIYTSTGSFSHELDYSIYSGLSNTVIMDASARYAPGAPYLYNLGSVTMDLFVDPIITIDPAYADRYAVEVSYIPYVPMPVPEPESYLLLLAGLGVIAAVRRRYEAAA